MSALSPEAELEQFQAYEQDIKDFYRLPPNEQEFDIQEYLEDIWIAGRNACYLHAYLRLLEAKSKDDARRMQAPDDEPENQPWLQIWIDHALSRIRLAKQIVDHQERLGGLQQHPDPTFFGKWQALTQDVQKWLDYYENIPRASVVDELKANPEAAWRRVQRDCPIKNAKSRGPNDYISGEEYTTEEEPDLGVAMPMRPSSNPPTGSSQSKRIPMGRADSGIALVGSGQAEMEIGPPDILSKPTGRFQTPSPPAALVESAVAPDASEQRKDKEHTVRKGELV